MVLVMARVRQRAMSGSAVAVDRLAVSLRWIGWSR